MDIAKWNLLLLFLMFKLTDFWNCTILEEENFSCERLSRKILGFEREMYFFSGVFFIFLVLSSWSIDAFVFLLFFSFTHGFLLLGLKKKKDSVYKKMLNIF